MLRYSIFLIRQWFLAGSTGFETGAVVVPRCQNEKTGRVFLAFLSADETCLRLGATTLSNGLSAVFRNKKKASHVGEAGRKNKISHCARFRGAAPEAVAPFD
jgi:hypothetical protein